jgi:predicted glycosyltransferase
MTGEKREKRALIYSHDSFGLGHLRRCRAIAHALVEHDPEMSVIILSGSPIIGNFDFRQRVDFVRVPGVIKLCNGDYTSYSLDLDIEQTVALRASIIQHTADIFDPDIFIVDKEPLGLRGEVGDTLEMLAERGTPLVLGLRDVMDEPGLLAPEWERKNVMPALTGLYDEIWVYGLPQICDPLVDIELPPAVRRKMVFTGYLEREAARAEPVAEHAVPFDGPYLLVTPGGGGDGEALVDWVLRAYELGDGAPPYPALLVFGPFMQKDKQTEFARRTSRLDNVEAITFEANIEPLIEGAAGIVAMGGYNTFCEILSFDKPALVVPRTVPRLEQYIRAKRAAELGLLRMLMDDGVRRAGDMATALRTLPNQGRPSDVVVPGLLDGLPNVHRLAARLIGNRGRPPISAVAE